MKIRLFVIFLALIMLLSLAACMHDGPPKEDTPEPSALDGVFVCGDSTFTFNGDGKSIVISIDNELAEQTGLPEGEHDGEYVFLLYNGSYRCDKAEDFRIVIGDAEYRFFNAIGTTDSDTVAFRIPDSGTYVNFEKR
ncbi:MAG: hypothetical protein IJT70_06055 [Clostridia bacterium]|nr:hypothetical protein [Clostridia bacterium]MBR0303016.1 hypothetical protein [Clostridia bacterium]